MMKYMKQTAIFAGGCFWCLEAVFSEVLGVEKVTSGYAGGKVVNPTYEQVCMGNTGHAECVRLEFNPEVVSYQTLLEIFFIIHDPTTLNRQGDDTGTQYRSAIFYVDGEQKILAEGYIQKLSVSGEFENQIVTEVVPLDHFYPAEDYHQNYYSENKVQPYCQLVISPKIKKFHEKFHDLLKPEYK